MKSRAGEVARWTPPVRGKECREACSTRTLPPVGRGLEPTNRAKIAEIGRLTTPDGEARIVNVEPSRILRRECMFRLPIRRLFSCALAVGGWVCAADSACAEVRGDYVESRTCDVYTGPCFANGEVGISGREAVLAWRIDSGTWGGVDLTGLGVVAIVKANDTLGFGGLFHTNPTLCEVAILSDKTASKEQQQALVHLVINRLKPLNPQVVSTTAAEFRLELDHLSGRAVLQCGPDVRLRTRRIQRGDCVCSNEVAFYPPLTEVENERAVYTERLDAASPFLKISWRTVGRRSAYVGTFETSESGQDPNSGD